MTLRPLSCEPGKGAMMGKESYSPGMERPGLPGSSPKKEGPAGYGGKVDAEYGLLQGRTSIIPCLQLEKTEAYKQCAQSPEVVK